jgi:hypothetical protein
MGGRIYVLVSQEPKGFWHGFGVNFPPKAEPLLEALKPGSEITFDAQITADSGGVRLENAELL